MRIAFALLIIIHGLVHFLGFAKAFQLAQIKELSPVISRPAGIFWLMAGLLMIAAAILFWQKLNFWWIAGITGLVISQILIISFNFIKIHHILFVLTLLFLFCATITQNVIFPLEGRNKTG